MTITPILILVGAIALAIAFELWFAYLDSKLVGFPEWPMGLWTLVFWICVVVAGGASEIIVKADVPSKWLPLLCVGFIHTLINFCCGDSILTFRSPDVLSEKSGGEEDVDLKEERQVSHLKPCDSESSDSGCVDGARRKEMRR